MENKESAHLQKAKAKLASHKNKPQSPEAREKEAIELASLILQEAIRIQTPREKKTEKTLARMMQDPRGKAFTMLMTDECFRSHKTRRIAGQLIYLLEQFGIPRYLNWRKRLKLKCFQKFGQTFHWLFAFLVAKALRKMTSSIILPGEKKAFAKHLAKRRKVGVRMHLHHLSKTILGEKKALKQLNIYLQDLEREEIESISVHISTLFSQINPLDWEKTIEVLADRLRQLYRKAMEISPLKFVYLDMAEYQDLHLTKELFNRVLEEEEFLELSAGIALQAYIPDSYPIMQELTEWAIKRREKGGAPIKIRIVKGANLKMEEVEASLHNWPQSPYKTKTEVDANFKRMVLYGSRRQHAEAVHLGIASHNLFDIAYAMLVRVENNIEKEITFEMFSGMADHMRHVVAELAGDMLLYCVVATKADFPYALSYLMRKLVEHTGSENFLRHCFDLKPDTKIWEEQVVLFTKACKQINTVSETPRRTQSRFDPPTHLQIDEPFQLEKKTDFSLPQNLTWAMEIVRDWREKSIEDIPLVIGGKEIHREQKGEGIDPSNPHETFYQYSLATWEDLEEALKTAKTSESSWQSTPVQKRCELMANVSTKMREKRDDLIGVMMRDVGKSLAEIDPEIAKAIDLVEYYLRQMQTLAVMKEIEFSSMGTILVAPSWNSPISIPTNGIVSGLVTGNCVLFKPAPEAVLSGWILVNLFWEAGIPKNVLQFLNCVDDPMGSQLIQDERLDGIILTGKSSTAQHFCKMHPNLSLFAATEGKNAMIITGMADRDLAIKDLVESAFGYSGQKCSAASLLILEAEVYDDRSFMQKLKDAVESLPIGSCFDLSSKIVPLIHPPSDALKKALTNLERGEKWLVEPKPDPNNPHLWSPGVKTGVRDGNFMHQTELFGPVIAVMRARDLNEAIYLANHISFGLTSGIHTLDQRDVSFWMKKIETGNGYINRNMTDAIVERQPFGGCKASFFGPGLKAGGPHYLLQFMHKKQLSIPKEKAPLPESINMLTRFLDRLDLTSEELGVWFASISNYAKAAKYFSSEHDTQKIVGQDNLLSFLPRKRMGFRILKEDPPLDILLVVAAAMASNCHIEVTYDPTTCPIEIDNEWKALQEISFTEETKEELIARIQWGSFERIRFLQKPAKEIAIAAAESATYLNFEPVLASGRLELLHYLREVTTSINYHRYGNLGNREGEIRSEIL